MAGPAKKKPTYRDHQTALAPLAKGDLPPVICIFGSSEYLLNHTVARLQARADAAGALYTGVEATTMTEQLAVNMVEQSSLFEPSTLYVLRRCEQAKTLQRFLKPLAPPKPGGNVLCFVYKGESPLAPLKAELTRLGAHFVPCFDPWPNEVPPVVQAMAKDHGIELRHDAVGLLMDAVGTDLVKLDHELAKLALIASGSEARALDAAAIAPHLGMIREDDAFQLDRLLLARQWARAHALADDLIERGEKPVALVGILANHCRNALRISTALRQGARPGDIGAGMRLPPFLIKTYAQQLTGADPRRYERALRQCHEVDVRLKSTPFDERLLIATIIDAIAT